MSDHLGDGVSRTLTPAARNFVTTVFQQNRPPLDSELNLISQVSESARQALLSANIPSGFVGDAVRARDDYQTTRQASNLFWLGKNLSDTEGDVVWANVNGWLIPLLGTNSTDSRNAITLPPPQATTTDADVNFVFLEVWKAQISPDGTANKPSQDTVWAYGNVEYGGTNPVMDFLDPAIAIETTERVQLQYRLRVVSAVNPALNPFGFNAQVKAQGTLAAPTTSVNPLYTFTNQGENLGDPGLWRAGDGDGANGLLNTVDGYVYAIPVCFVFRRSTQSWSALQQAGAFNRFPDMTDRSQATVLPTIALTADVDTDATTLAVDTAQSATTFDPAGGLLRVDGEIMTYSSYVGNTITLSERGSKNTAESNHDTGATVEFVTGHPLGLFADQITPDDIYDLRHMVSLGPVDFNSLLAHNFNKLVKGELSTAWKKSSAGVKGTRHFQVDYIGAAAVAPDFQIKGDAPDGFRKIFSDACALQPENLVVLGTNGATQDATDLPFNPAVDIFRQDAANAEDWNTGDVISIALDQYRNTFSSANDEKVRFVHPFEYDDTDHATFKLWFGDTDPESADPLKQEALTIAEGDADPHFVVLGTPLTDLAVASSGQADVAFTNTTIAVAPGAASGSSVDVGLDFTADAATIVDAGAYLLLTPGDDPTATQPENHGAFKVVGVDASGYLVVTNPDGSEPVFDTATTTNRTWGLYLEACSEQDDQVFIALASTAAVGTDTALYLSYDLLYHPLSGLARAPERGLYVDLDAATPANYLREDDFENVVASPAATVKRSPALPASAFPHKRHDEFVPRDGETLFNTETVWGEAYVDPGSKTLIYQPMRNISLRLDPQPVPSARSYTDVTSLFNLGVASDSLLVPREIRGGLGRHDVPFVTSMAAGSANSTAPAYGINHLLLSGSQNVNAPFVQQRLVAVYDPVNLTSSDFGTYPDLSAVGGGPGGTNALVCRYYNQGGVRGIEIPANYGIARLFAIYHQDDFYNISPGVSNFAPTVTAPFRTDAGIGRDNLLREDGERRSLIITADNTFVIPEDVLDQSYLTVNLENTSLVFEFAAFFFDDWQAEYTRIHRLAAAGVAGQSYQVFVPGPSEAGDQLSVVSTRVPYQGAIYGTMPISTTDTASVEFVDYVPKRTAETPTEVLQLATPFTDPADARVENGAVVEILAAMPFATTLGTGAIAGPVVPGSYTDVGYLTLADYPFTDLTDAPRPARVRAHPAPAGTTPIARVVGETLLGATERLPMGLLTSDAQFLAEGLGEAFERFWVPSLSMDLPGDYRQDYPLSKSFMEGALLVSDGTAAGSAALTGYDPSFNLYRTYRGGTAAVASGRNPGGAFALTGPRVSKDLSYVTSPRTQDLSMHGGVMLGVALLVRTQKELVTTSDREATYGEELQIVVATGLQLGKDLDVSTGALSKEFVDLVLQTHPTGLGEGRNAVDRYRVEGRPLVKGARRLITPDQVDVFPARDPSLPGVDPCVCP